MDSVTRSYQERFQLAVSAENDRIQRCPTLSAHTKNLLLDYLQTAAASSDEPVTVKERIDLAQSTVRERRDVSAIDYATVKTMGEVVLHHAIEV